jgi:hypothetical protein
MEDRIVQLALMQITIQEQGDKVFLSGVETLLAKGAWLRRTRLILMMAALGGCWFPLQMMNLPPLLDTVCNSTMAYWAMTGHQGMLCNQLPWLPPPR